MKLIEVDPDSISNIREGHRGRLSYPILKMFLELGKPLVMLDRTGMQQNKMSIFSTLNTYLRTHDLPIKAFQRAGEIYLMRTDTDASGKVAPADIDAVLRSGPAVPDPSVAPPITDDEVARRFAEEKDAQHK